MKVRFYQNAVPCISDEVVIWHLKHGWVWDVVLETEGRRQETMVRASDLSDLSDLSDGRTEEGSRLVDLGVFFCTLLCGDGVIVHFSVREGVKVPFFALLAAFRKGIGMVARSGVNVILATIPEDRAKLRRILIRMGFRLTDLQYCRNGKTIVTLKYYPPPKRYIIPSSTPKNER